MTITVEAPGGITIDFPDGTSQDVIAGAMRKALGQPDPAKPVETAAPLPAFGDIPDLSSGMIQPSQDDLAKRDEGLTRLDAALSKAWPYRVGKDIYRQITGAIDTAHGAWTGEKPLTGDSAIKFGGDVGLLFSPAPVARGTGKLIARDALESPAARIEPPPLSVSSPPPAPQELPVLTVPSPRAKPAEPPPLSSGNDVIDAAARQGIDVPRSVASDSMVVQRLGSTLKNVPFAGDPLVKSAKGTADQLLEKVGSVADELGQGTGPNVANRVASTLEQKAAEETAAARAAAAAADRNAMAEWEAGRSGSLSAIDRQQQAVTQAADRSIGSMTPNEMGEALSARLRATEEAARARKDALYRTADVPGAAFINSDAVRGVRATVGQALEQAGRVVDRELTPASAKMLDKLSELSDLRIPNKATGPRTAVAPGETAEITAVDLSGIEHVRKVLSGLAQGATNDADRSAARMIMRQYEGWLTDAFDNALYSGRPEALEAWRRAIAANADWRRTFYNRGRTAEDADKIINRIVTGEVTPQEVSNWVIGATKVGASGQSARLIDRIATATNNDPQALASIRSGVWSKLSAPAEGVTAKSPERTADTIFEFLNGSGRSVAERLYTDEQRGVMRAYATSLRNAKRDRQSIEAVSSALMPSETKVSNGPMQQLADDVIGKGRAKSDEAIFSAIDGYARSGNKGDLNTLAQIIRTIPPEQKGELAGAIVRNMGISPRTKEWSGDVFISNWNNYSQGAKTLLFGNAGQTRRALDDIAIVSRKFKELQQFANPSGTGQTVFGGSILTGLIAAPLTTISTVIGGRQVAAALSESATARAIAQWSKAYEKAAALQVKKAQRTTFVEPISAAENAAYSGLRVASKQLSASLSNALGISVRPDEFLRPLQGAVGGRAQGSED